MDIASDRGSRKGEGNRSERINGEGTGKDYWNLTKTLG